MPKPSKGLGLKQTAKMARALTQDKYGRTIGFINEEDVYVVCIIFNFKIISIISSPSDVGRDAYRAYRVEIRPLHVEQGAPTTQEVINHHPLRG